MLKNFCLWSLLECSSVSCIAAFYIAMRYIVIESTLLQNSRMFQSSKTQPLLHKTTMKTRHEVELLFTYLTYFVHIYMCDLVWYRRESVSICGWKCQLASLTLFIHCKVVTSITIQMKRKYNWKDAVDTLNASVPFFWQFLQHIWKQSLISFLTVNLTLRTSAFKYLSFPCEAYRASNIYFASYNWGFSPASIFNGLYFCLLELWS